MAGPDLHAEAISRAEQLLREAEEAAGKQDGDAAVRRARDAAFALEALSEVESPSAREKGRGRRSPLYVRAVRAAVKAGRWAEARQLASHLRFTRDALYSHRRELAEVIRECNRNLDVPQPPSECDLVLKGGITSGIVYPLALVELHKQYRFRDIGGASVGAVAAAAAAAAEYSAQVSRRTHATEAPNQGFAGLALLPDELGGVDPSTRRSKLLSPFRAQPETQPAMDVLLAALGGRTVAGKVLAALVAVLKAEPLPFAVSAVIGVMLV
jgi:hypothetical protein